MFQSLLQTNPETQKLADIICTVTDVEKLFLLGSTQTQKRTASIFNYEQPSCRCTSHYYVLVLVNKSDESSHSCIQDKIENNLQHFIPVTAIVLWTDQFSNWLGEAHPFASVVVQRALLLYDNGEQMPQAIPPDEILLQQSRQKYYTKGLTMMQEFLAGAEMYRIRKQHAMAAFMLHQCAEHGLRTLMKITTGLKTNSHNLDKLIRYCSMAVHGVTGIFNKERQQGKRLFDKLQAAYIDARYKDYSIGHEELLEIEQQLRAFIEIFKRYNPSLNTTIGSCKESESVVTA